MLIKCLLIITVLTGCLEINDTITLKRTYPEDKEGVCQNGVDDDENGIMDCEEITCKEWCQNDN